MTVPFNREAVKQLLLAAIGCALELGGEGGHDINARNAVQPLQGVTVEEQSEENMTEIEHAIAFKTDAFEIVNEQKAEALHYLLISFGDQREHIVCIPSFCIPPAPPRYCSRSLSHLRQRFCLTHRRSHGSSSSCQNWTPARLHRSGAESARRCHRTCGAAPTRRTFAAVIDRRTCGDVAGALG